MLAKGMASIHIGGNKSAYDECVAVFEGFTASNFYVGDVGDGSRMKILANYLVHVHNVAAAECMTLGQKAGLAPDLIYSVIKESAGASKMFDIRGKMMSESDYREGGGTMFEIYEKDASIITEFAAEVKAPIDLYVIGRQKFNSAMALGLGHLDTSAVCKAVEISAGINRKMVED
jgi:3-hydroxyisobutyrate dehydrogenase-like beta-hydroxyacid dehydrogenase